MTMLADDDLVEIAENVSVEDNLDEEVSSEFIKSN